MVLMLTTDSCRRLEERLRRPLLCCLLLRVRLAARDLPILPSRHRCARSTRPHTCRAAALARQPPVRTRTRTRRRQQINARAHVSQPARLATRARRNDPDTGAQVTPPAPAGAPADGSTAPPQHVSAQPYGPTARPHARPPAARPLARSPARPPARPHTEPPGRA